MGFTQAPTGGPCQDLLTAMVDEYGENYMDDYLKKDPDLMSASLSQIVTHDCKDYFNYNGMVRQFCSDEDHLLQPISSTKTCQDLDIKGNSAALWCMKKDKSDDYYPRMKTRTDVCNEDGLKSKWHITAGEYCRKYPEDDWCKCYNVKENKKICKKVNGVEQKYGPKAKPAAGCNLFNSLELNKPFLKDGYDILNANMHCTRKTCSRPKFQYIPEGAMSSCKPSYRMCDKDIDIINDSSGKIALACNVGMAETEKPDWWDDEDDGDDSWLYGDRKPPFDKFPLNRTPVTEWPEEFDWEDDNVRYLSYSGVGSISLCCLCIIIIMTVVRSKKLL
jgi:hypothetical protein